MAVMRRALWLAPTAAEGAHVRALDGLRGLAVLIVIGSHLSNAGWLVLPDLSGTGKGGVYLFFVLSAYLLSCAMLSRPLSAMADARYWFNYALRRVLRIWPLYLVVLLLSWILTRVGVAGWHYQMDTPTLIAHLALREGHSVLWSIPVEFTFYLWLPVIVLPLVAVRRVPGGRWLGLALLAIGLLWAHWRWPAALAPINGVALGPYVVVFLCGVAAAWVRLSWPALGRYPRAWRWLAGLLLALLVLATPSVWARLHGMAVDPGLSQRWFMPFGTGWALLLLAVLWGGGALARVFSSAPLRLVGVVSFSAYLWHMPVLQVAEALGLRAWGAAGVPLILVVVLLVSMLSFLLFERPWRDVRLPSGRTRAQPAEADTRS